jgi:4-hydroxybutyryl-CoA dehydratase/vinylacetyl-CoA-Delta-isomerase
MDAISHADTAAAREARFRPIRTGDEYVASLRGRGVQVYLFGTLIEEPVDHPIIRPSINALRETYERCRTPNWRPRIRR